MKFNVNNWVKVKLTDRGFDILRLQHEVLRLSVPSIGEFRSPEVDSDGYSKFQLWCFMQDFGPHVGLGIEMPFDSEIIIVGDS